MRKLLTTISLALVAVFGLAACGSSDPVVVTDDVVIIDVRTPAEYAEGHLEGAVNIDVSAPGFAEAIADLAADGEYIVYCRSGNRSAQAAAIMRDQGLENITDLGSLENASTSTGLVVVTD